MAAVSSVLASSILVSQYTNISPTSFYFGFNSCLCADSWRALKGPAEGIQGLCFCSKTAKWMKWSTFCVKFTTVRSTRTLKSWISRCTLNESVKQGLSQQWSPKNRHRFLCTFTSVSSGETPIPQHPLLMQLWKCQGRDNSPQKLYTHCATSTPVSSVIPGCQVGSFLAGWNLPGHWLHSCQDNASCVR